MIKYITTILFSTLMLLSCPFDEANVEVTILAHKSISKAIQSKDFEKVLKELEHNKELYEYFKEEDGSNLYQPLVSAAKAKDSAKVKTLLDRSLVLEIKELLDQVEKNFDKYQKSRLLLIKAKKHLKALTKKKKPMTYMKKILKSIGNPGLMGVGKREPDKTQFLENKQLLLREISSKL